MTVVSSGWSGLRVLITGASGFIGSPLAQELRRRAADVHGVSRSKRHSRDGSVTWWQADLTNSDATRDVLARIRPDVVYHLSSLADGGLDVRLVLPTFQSDTVATVNVLAAAATARIRRLILAGSLEEPSAGEAASSPYAAAKAASRVYGTMFHALYGMPVVWARIFMTYGPGQPDWKLIPYCTRAFLQGVSPRIASPDRQVDWIHVEDVVQGLVSVGQTPGIDGETFDLGSGQLVPIADVVRQIQSRVNPAVPWECDRAVAPAKPVRCADVGATHARLAWRPRLALETGLERTITLLVAGTAAGSCAAPPASVS